MEDLQEEKTFTPHYMWQKVLLASAFHLGAIYGAYLMFTDCKWQTTVVAFIMIELAELGITAGVHRLWTHRSYDAKLPLRIFLAICQAIAFQKDIYKWTRDHRIHHKYTDTDTDPHNATRGFFFSHIGWLLCKPNPLSVEKGKTIDFSDLLADPVVRFQKKYFRPIGIVFSFILPTIIPMYYWGESFRVAFFVAVIFRFVFSLHLAFIINSAAHIWGYRPVDASIKPAQFLLFILMTNGEGFHNYHHIFPYDYAASEYGMKFNITTAFLNLMALIGQAYNLKTVSKSLVLERRNRTGKKYPDDKEPFLFY